jgi:hypothetical protein
VARRHAYSDDEPRPVLLNRFRVPRKDGAGVPSALGELLDWHDGITAYRDPGWMPKVARRVFVAVVATTAHPPVGRGSQFFFFAFFSFGESGCILFF